MTEINAATIGRPAARPAGAATGGVLADYRDIVRDFWRSRELLIELARRDIRIRYKQAIMGFGWAIFMPLLIVMSGCLVRFAMMQMSGGSLNRAAIGSIAVKSLPWAFFVGSINFATASLTGNINLVTKIYFPREVLPLSSTLAQSFDTAIGALALAVMMPFIGGTLSPALVWVPVLILLLFLFTSGTTLFLSCANLFFRDVKYIVQVLVTFGIFFTPVFFEPVALGHIGAKLIMLNPIAPILEGFRLSIIQGHNLLEPLMIVGPRGSAILEWSPWFLAYSAAWAVLGFLGASLLFHRAEYAFAEYV